MFAVCRWTHFVNSTVKRKRHWTLQDATAGLVITHTVSCIFHETQAHMHARSLKQTQQMYVLYYCMELHSEGDYETVPENGAMYDVLLQNTDTSFPSAAKTCFLLWMFGSNQSLTWYLVFTTNNGFWQAPALQFSADNDDWVLLFLIEKLQSLLKFKAVTTPVTALLIGSNPKKSSVNLCIMPCPTLYILFLFEARKQTRLTQREAQYKSFEKWHVWSPQFIKILIKLSLNVVCASKHNKLSSWSSAMPSNPNVSCLYPISVWFLLISTSSTLADSRMMSLSLVAAACPTLRKHKLYKEIYI